MDVVYTKITRFLLIGLIELVVGILLFINPVGFTAKLIILSGIILIIFGLKKAIHYFRDYTADAILSNDLSAGILYFCAGLLLSIGSKHFLAVFPSLPFFYGLAFFALGIEKTQWTIDLYRIKKAERFIVLIDTVLSFVASFLIAWNPFPSEKILWILIGISLIIEALLDILVFRLWIKQK